MDGPGQIGITFSSEGFRLLGTLLLARGPEPKPTAVLLHGIPGIEKNYDLAHELRESGWNSLIFHYRGCWGSRGDYRVETIPVDVEAAFDCMDSGRYPQVDRERLFVVGHSLGGWAAILAAAADPRIKGAAVYAAISDPSAQDFPRTMIAREFIPFLSGIDTHTFAAEWNSLPSNLTPTSLVQRISPRPLLIIHSLADEVVPFAQSQRLHEYAQEPKILLAHPNANHSFTWHRPWLIGRILSWLSDLV